MLDGLYQQVKIIEPVAGTLQERMGEILIRDGHTNILETDTREHIGGINTYNGAHLVVAPGLVDLYSHSGEPGYEERETLASLLQAARSGGFARVNILPDTLPTLDRVSSIISLQHRYREVAADIANCPQIGYWGALTEGLEGMAMTELAELATVEIAGWADGKPIGNLQLIWRLLEYLQPLNKPIALYACDRELRGNGIARNGVQAVRFGLPVDPVSSETAALVALLEVVADVGTPVHLMRISTRRGVEAIAAAKQRGLPITASTTWLHLIADTDDLITYNPNFKLEPPLGNPEDKIALIEAIKTGVLDAIAIDHTPHTYEDKTVPFGETPAGAIGLELALPLLWQHLVVAGKLTAVELWQALSSNPAKCLQQPLSTELILFNTQHRWTVTPQTLASLSHNTAWLNREILGKVLANNSIVDKSGGGSNNVKS
jgi:dihydroorotase